MVHLGFAWIWVMAGLLIGVLRLNNGPALGWIPLLLPLAPLLVARSRWGALLRPLPGVKALCWLGHGLMAGAAACFALMLLSPSEGGNVFGFGLLFGLLVIPLPWIGAAAWLVQGLQAVRACRPASAPAKRP